MTMMLDSSTDVKNSGAASWFCCLGRKSGSEVIKGQIRGVELGCGEMKRRAEEICWWQDFGDDFSGWLFQQ
jgi:hypothetical protein